MRLSILIGTTGTGLLPCSRALQACSWASPDVEVIVRDVSGDAQKRDLLASLQQEHCRIIFANPSDAWTNFKEAFRQANGDFVFRIDDDDISFDKAIAALPAAIEQNCREPSIVGMTGSYVVETVQGSTIMGYTNAESEDVTARVAGYLTVGGRSLLSCAPIRREVVQRVITFVDALPFQLPFHDRITALLYLLNGKFVRLKRFLYLHNSGELESEIAVQNRDADGYRDAGLDPSVNLLHWYLCGFEGAVLARHAQVFPDYLLAQRQAVADRWFSSMFTRFKGRFRQTAGSHFTTEAQQICTRLQNATGQLSFEGMLGEICALIALSSENAAKRYYDYWQAMITRHQPVIVQAETAVERRAVSGV